MKQQHHIITFCITMLITLVSASASYADSACNPVKNEMTVGEALLQHPNNRLTLPNAIKEFKAATIRAPQCAKAFYNLGLSYEGRKQYDLAIEAFRTYLDLSPQAQNFKAIENKTFKLEYLARKEEERKRIEERNRKYANISWENFEGTWCIQGTCDSTENSITHKDWLRFPDRNTYNIDIKGDVFEANMQYNNYLEGAGTFIHKKHFIGKIDKEGGIKGTYTDGNIQPSGRCAGEFFRYTAPFTGKLTKNGNKQTINLQWKWWLGLRHNMTECILYKGRTGRWIKSDITLIHLP